MSRVDIGVSTSLEYSIPIVFSISYICNLASSIQESIITISSLGYTDYNLDFYLEELVVWDPDTSWKFSVKSSYNIIIRNEKCRD